MLMSAHRDLRYSLQMPFHCHRSRHGLIRGISWFALLATGLVMGSNASRAQIASGSGGQTPATIFVVHGTVTSGTTPLPGATVTAVLEGQTEKRATWTDVDGSYALPVPGSGHYTITVQMSAFATETHTIEVQSAWTIADFALVLLSRSEQSPAKGQTAASTSNTNRGFHSLTVTQAENGQDTGNGNEQVVPSGMPIPGIAADAASESITVAGSASGASTLSMDEMEQRMREGREQDPFGRPGIAPGGGPFGGGFGGGPRGFGGRRGGRFNFNQPHGTVYYSAGDSALNASPYSLTGAPVSKPGYLQQRFGGSLGGPLNIPKLYQGGSKTFFFVNYNGARSATPYDAFSTVPTALERQGNFSQTVYSSGTSAGLPVQIFDPLTNAPFPNNTLPQLDSVAQGLLAYIPLPNLPGAAKNFHYVTSVDSNSDDLNIRVNHALGGASAGPRRRGPQNNISAGFHFHRADNIITNPFPTVGGKTSVRGIDVPLGYTRSFGKLINTLRVDFNRNRISTQNLYAFTQDITGDLGIGGVSTNPFDWGLPSLSFSHYTGLTDTNPLLRRDQTWTFSDSMIWNRGKHTWRWGGDFRRIQLNTQTDSNARGSFVFTGFNTSEIADGQAVSGTGYDFADFLLGLAQQTSVQFGENNYHFRGNSWDLFVQDEWRLRSNLTLNLGLRYEYVSPFTETDGRIVNLDVAPGYTAAVPVLPGGTGPFSGTYPSSLLRPDRNNFAPRLGVAWKALPNTVVRAGYGINYNTGAYSAIVQQLAFQPPFSTTQTNVQASGAFLTLEDGFPAAPPGSVTNNYGVDVNYRLGYVQIWNADVQQQIRPGVVLNLDYTGTKGTRLDIVQAPNRTADGTLIPGVQPFLFETSPGDSTAHAGTVKLRKRLQNGLSIGGSYTYSKSIDNASTIGGGGTVVAQDAFNLAAERGLSSFDQRHRLTADYLWELPFGHDRRWLTQPGILRALAGDWNWSGAWTIASGLPFTPRVLGDFGDVSRGTNGTLRANLTGAPIALPDPSVLQWFNTAAFVAPPTGTFGDARRNSVEGPGQVDFDAAFTKIIPLRETRSLELRAQFTNIFNTPHFTSIDTVVNSPTFGQVVGVGAMRSVLLTARFRF